MVCKEKVMLGAKKVLVVSPHPDDETLGCGGTLLKHKQNGDSTHCLIITEMKENMGWEKETIKRRKNEINRVSKKYAFDSIDNLKIPTTRLDMVSKSDLITKINVIFKKVKPEIIYIPFVLDVHTDHQIVSEAICSITKWFRYAYVQKIMMFETLSETEFNFLSKRSFKPNIFVDISSFLKEKIEIMKLYKSEFKNFPFPRSEKAIRSLAYLRGSQSGYNAAEAFELVYERL